MGYFQRRDLYASKTASGVTSETYRVADAVELSLQLTGSPSTTTVQGSNSDGLNVDITNTTDDWSTISTVIGAEIVDIEPGFNYLRCLRSETTGVVLGGWFKTH